MRWNRQINGRGIVDAGIDATEVLGPLRDGRHHLLLVAHIHNQEQCTATRLLDRFSGAVDRPRELRMRLGRLGCNDHAGALARNAMANPMPRLWQQYA